MSKSYLINLEDGEDGEVILPFPSEMLTELGWIGQTTKMEHSQ